MRIFSSSHPTFEGLAFLILLTPGSTILVFLSQKLWNTVKHQEFELFKTKALKAVSRLSVYCIISDKIPTNKRFCVVFWLALLAVRVLSCSDAFTRKIHIWFSILGTILALLGLAVIVDVKTNESKTTHTFHIHAKHLSTPHGILGIITLFFLVLHSSLSVYVHFNENISWSLTAINIFWAQHKRLGFILLILGFLTILLGVVLLAYVCCLHLHDHPENFGAKWRKEEGNITFCQKNATQLVDASIVRITTDTVMILLVVALVGTSFAVSRFKDKRAFRFSTATTDSVNDNIDDSLFPTYVLFLNLWVEGCACCTVRQLDIPYQRAISRHSSWIFLQETNTPNTLQNSVLSISKSTVGDAIKNQEFLTNELDSRHK